MTEEVARSLAKNTTLQIAGKVTGTILGILSVAILLRHLGDFGFGEFTTAITYLSLFAIVADFGLTLTTVQLISRPGADEPTILGNLFAMRLLSGFVLFVFAPILALLLPYSTDIKLAIAVGALAYFSATISQMLTGIFQKRLVMWRVVIAELANRSVFLVGAILVSVFDFTLIEVVIALVLGNFTQTVLIIVLSKKFVRIRSQIDLTVWKEILRASWPIGVSIMFNLIYLRGDIIALSLLRGEAEVGLYGGAYKVIDVVTALPVMFMGLTLPILVHAYKSRDMGRFKKTLEQTLNFFSMIGFPITVGAFALAEPIMVLVGGEEFRASGVVLKILAPTAAVVFLGALYGHTIVAIEKQKPMVFGYAAVAAVSVAAYLVFIPKLGMQGAAWVTLLSESLILFITFVVVTRASRVLPNFLVLFRVLAACAIMYIFLEVVELHVVAEILLGGAVYVAALVAFGGLTVDSVRRIVRGT